MCLSVAVTASQGADNDLSSVARPSYPARRDVYRIPDLKNLVNRRLTNAFVYGDFIVRKAPDGTVIFQPYSAIGLLGNISDPLIVRRLMAEGNLLLGATRVIVDEASSPIPLVADFPIHIPLEAPLELLKVGNAQAGNVVAEARFRGRPNAPSAPTPAPIAAAPAPPDSPDKYLLTDARTGARVWRPYQQKIEWKGNLDAAHFATGQGSLRVFTKDGKLAAQIDGTMQGGRLVGSVTALYPLSPDRASYRGEYANWSENGRGVMTFRNGQTIEGIWRDGELVEKVTAQSGPPSTPAPLTRKIFPAATTGVFQPGPASQWNPEHIPPSLSADILVTGNELETMYKQLRDALPADAKTKLTTAQRAWIVYQDLVLKLAQKHWGARIDSPQRTTQLDYAMSLQRVEELRAMKAAFDGAPIEEPPPDVRIETHQRLTDFTRTLQASGLYNKAMLDQMLAKWTDSAIGGAQAIPLSGPRKEALVNAMTVMASQHQLDLFDFWHTAAWMKEAPLTEGTPLVPPKMAGAPPDELLKEVAEAWTKAAPGELPAALPPATAQKLAQRLARRDPAGGSDPEAELLLETALGLQKALTAPSMDFSALDGLVAQAAKLTSTPAWLSVFAKALEFRRSKALELQGQALTLLEAGDGEAAKGRLRTAEQQYPSGALRSWVEALEAQQALARDKTLRAVDSDWRQPALPEKKLLAEAERALKALRIAEGPEVLPDLKQLAGGLEAAALLASFANDCEPSGGKDTTHPLRALQALRRTESYMATKDKSTWASRPFLLRLEALDELLAPQLKEYETLLGQGRALEAEGKYLKAAAAYRAAQALDSSREVQQDIVRCEAKTSGL